MEKAKPAAGTGNVQGKVLYNSQPVENIEVKLCETFNRFMGGCTGQAYTVRTDRLESLFTNVAPKTYEALTAQVFDTGLLVSPASPRNMRLQPTRLSSSHRFISSKAI